MSQLIELINKKEKPELSVREICKRVEALEKTEFTEEYKQLLEKNGDREFLKNKQDHYKERELMFKINNKIYEIIQKKLLKYKNDDYFGENSPFGKGKEGDGDFGRVIANFGVGHALKCTLKDGLPNSVMEGYSLPFRYNEDLIGISKYNLPNLFRGEDVYNRIKKINDLREAYKLSGMENQDVLKIFEISSERTISKIHKILKSDFTLEGSNTHPEYFKERLHNLQRVLDSNKPIAEQWRESMKIYLFLAETVPKMTEFKTLKNYLVDHLLEKYFVDKWAKKCPYRTC